MTLQQVWADLEKQGAETGAYRRRIHPEAVVDLYLVVHKPENSRGLLVDVDLSGVELGELPAGRGVDLRWVTGTGGHPAIELVLAQPAFRDLFDALVTDVAETAALATDAGDAAQRVAERMRRWQTFLKTSGSGLSGERQRGLYGELYFLSKVLTGRVPTEAAVESWKGPYRARQDFSFGTFAVEVKTTVANLHQNLRISSERQLDTTPLPRGLDLFHLSVDGRPGAGQTLPEIVAEVRGKIGSSAQFEDSLFAAGYLDAQAVAYVTGYTVREANVFRVTESFPRLQEKDCPNGVAEVTYSVAVSALGPFLIDVGQLLASIGTAGADV